MYFDERANGPDEINAAGLEACERPVDDAVGWVYNANVCSSGISAAADDSR